MDTEKYTVFLITQLFTVYFLHQIVGCLRSIVKLLSRMKFNEIIKEEIKK